MAPTYRLTYFNIRGLAEPIRLIFAYSGVEYEDIRVEKVDWPQMKPSTPFGKLPILEEDGVQVTQHVTICRYLAKKFDLVGKDDIEARRCDEIVDTVGDIRSSLTSLRQETDEVKKEEKFKALVAETLPFYCAKFEEIVKNNNGWLVGSDLTWADIYVAYMFELLGIFLNKDAIANYPGLKEHRSKVFGFPTIKSWIEKRPVTDM